METGRAEEVPYVVLDISSTSGRRDDLLDSGSVGGENLLLESTDGKDLTSQRHLSSHCYGTRQNQHTSTDDPFVARRTEIRADSMLREQRHECGEDSDSSRWSFLPN